ncbi:MAG TPA: 4-hydroxy-tetrahydrodipicolinate reductase [Anaerovoracaceae bacterium]|nr:4-hydroxy-tetrahydrodipicolinate reductase [Anaerovoracaceae bacterium]
MINIIMVGNGKMAVAAKDLIGNAVDMECVGTISNGWKGKENKLSQLTRELSASDVKVHAIIDFSHPDNLEMIVESLNEYPVPLIMGTTGFTDGQIKKIETISDQIPVVYASNFSAGIALVRRFLKEARTALGDGFDIEIIEKHHRRKVDSPSGTAITLLNEVDPQNEFVRTYGREGMGGRSREIGIHSVRGGNIAGEHTIIFAGDDEVIEITHRAGSNIVFAKGAIQAVRFIQNKKPGLYDMVDVLSR